MKKIIYVAERPHHIKMLYSLQCNDFDQLFIIPSGNNIGKLQINKTVFYTKYEEIKNIVSGFVPDTYVQTRTNSSLHQFLMGKKIKIDFINHGILVDCVSVRNNLIKAKNMYNNYNACFVATRKIDEYMLKKYVKFGNKIITNAITQFDYLKEISETKYSKDKKAILFVGAPNPARPTIKIINKDYYDAVISLYNICKENGLLFIIKPRANDGFMFLKNNIGKLPWAQSAYDKYNEITSDKDRVIFMKFDDDIYDYFGMADIVVCNGWTTAEIEACMMKKALIVFKTKDDAEGDYYDTVKSGAAVLINNIQDLNKKIEFFINNGNTLIDLQDKCINDLGLIFDGKSYQRVNEELKNKDPGEGQ